MLGTLQWGVKPPALFRCPPLPCHGDLMVAVATGRSVVVRVNDRGPFVPGRVVDVSYSAAASLGIIDRGTAKVKLDVVQ